MADIKKWRITFDATVSLTVDIEDEDEDYAEERGAKAVENFLNTYFPGPVRIDGSIDGVPASNIEEVKD